VGLHARAQEVLVGPNHFHNGAFGRFDRTGSRLSDRAIHLYVILGMRPILAGERARRRVEETFSCEKLAENMGKLYIELTDQEAC